MDKITIAGIEMEWWQWWLTGGVFLYGVRQIFQLIILLRKRQKGE